jgi:hypothetical protein
MQVRNSRPARHARSASDSGRMGDFSRSLFLLRFGVAPLRLRFRCFAAPTSPAVRTCVRPLIDRP